VLVACDEPLTRWAVEQALAPRGHELMVVATRDRACEELFRRGFDAVVIGESLEGQDMIDVCRQFAASNAGTRLIVLSDDERSPEMRSRLPHALVLEKPFSLDDLIEGVSPNRSV
jgi:DNA-binding NtrC family response regulator